MMDFMLNWSQNSVNFLLLMYNPVTISCIEGCEIVETARVCDINVPKLFANGLSMVLLEGLGPDISRSDIKPKGECLECQAVRIVYKVRCKVPLVRSWV